jgi:hypothetical protein
MHVKFHHATRLLLCLLTATGATRALAASYELRVYSDDIPQQNEAEIELIASVAQPKPSSSGPNTRVAQLLLEYGYGLGHGWAIGLELPMSQVQGQRKLEGLKAEVQYVAPHAADVGFYWGIRGDVGYTSTPYDSQGGNSIGLNPILGYRWSTWHLTVNPSFEIPLSGESTKAQFQPSAKISKSVNVKRQLGFEYFSNWGPASAPLARQRRDETLYAVWDEQLNAHRLQLGLGRPLHPVGGSVDKWVVKFGMNVDID